MPSRTAATRMGDDAGEYLDALEKRLFNTWTVRLNCALVCRRYRPASGTSSFTMRTDVAASDPPSDSARSSRRRPIRGAPWVTPPVSCAKTRPF